MNKLAVVVPFYKRPELTKLCFKMLRDQSKRLGFDVIVAGSEGEESKKLARGFKYIEVENQPLGRKLNALIKECRDYDGVIIMGSDDFMSDSIIEMYQDIDCSKPVYYVFDDVYVYSAKYKEVRSGLDYKNRPSGCGIGRMYTKKSLEMLNYLIWDNTRAKGLDADAARRCASKGITPEWVELGDHFLIDAKVEDNITSHDVVLLRDTKHPLTIMKRLGKIGDDILNMELGNERIYSNKELSTNVKKYKAKVIKSFHQFKEGDIVAFKYDRYRDLLRAGFIDAAN